MPDENGLTNLTKVDLVAGGLNVTGLGIYNDPDFNWDQEDSGRKYDVTITPTENGTVKVDPTSAAAGTQVTITATPDQGYEVGSIVVTDAEGNTIPLSGKEAVFSVTLNAITQSVVPTLTDEWVETNFAASDDLHTADALRQYFDSALYANNLDNAAMDYLLTNSTFKEVPTQITSYYIRMFLNYHSQLATQYGMELDAYAQAKGYADADAMLADSDAYFEHLAKQDLVFQAIAEQLDITPTQEQIDSANSSYADTYGAQRSMLNALQLAVLDKVEESVVLS